MLSPIVPEGGEQKQDWMRFAPFGDDFSLLILVRRFHSLRSFHQRLLKVGPLWRPEDDEGLCKREKAPYINTSIIC